MTLDEARNNIGELVSYEPYGGTWEHGVITDVNDYFVFVRYGRDYNAKATNPAKLKLLREVRP